jgi:hypothetical protein
VQLALGHSRLDVPAGGFSARAVAALQKHAAGQFQQQEQQQQQQQSCRLWQLSSWSSLYTAVVVAAAAAAARMVFLHDGSSPARAAQLNAPARSGLLI